MFNFLLRTTKNLVTNYTPWDNILDLIEAISDELFWAKLFGPRLFALIKRYAGNDTIIVCVFMSLVPTISAFLQDSVGDIFRDIARLFFVSVTIDDEELIYSPVDEYLTKNFQGVKKLRNVRGKTGYSDPTQKRSYYQEETSQEETPLIELVPETYKVFKIYYKGRTFYVSRYEETGRAARTRSESSNIRAIEIRAMAYSVETVKVAMQEWINEYYESRKNKLILYKCTFGNSRWWDEDNCWKEHGIKKIRSFNTVVLKENDQNKILDDIITFKKSKTWYQDRGIPYRRSYLLYGPPGTGKTSYIQSLASEVKMFVSMLNLSAAESDNDLSNALAKVPKNSILVIEDIDHYKFEEGVSDNDDDFKKYSRKGSVSVSGILNALDGITSSEESIIIMTCNDMNTIPPALIRPGRVDLKLELGYIDDYQTELFFWRFFYPEVKEKHLKDMPKSNYPEFCRIIKAFIRSMREQASRHKIDDKPLEVSPAELISHLLFHALKFELSVKPENLQACLQSISDHIEDLIKLVAANRKQAIEHENKKNKSAVSQISDKDKPETETCEKENKEEAISTPPTSPTSDSEISQVSI